jgi:hypothetical protein
MGQFKELPAVASSLHLFARSPAHTVAFLFAVMLALSSGQPA